MIKLKLTLTNKDKNSSDYDIVDGELLSDAVKRITKDIPLPEGELSDVFIPVVNGHIIEKDFWTYTKLNKNDTVLITPRIKGGDFGQTFKQVAIIVVAAMASVLLTPATGPTIYSALAVAGATMAAGLIMNALIPPPVPDLGGIGGGNFSESQTYNISGQSNSIRRFKTVPRVYGRHRIFPSVAANPYTELDVDPDTGELIQYLYAIYDFGFGPLAISDIKIGDTDLSTDNFGDFYFRLVDLNPNPSPTTPQELQTEDSFEYYKGDLSGDPVSVALNGNEDLGDPEEEWQAIRNTSVNTDGVNQEILLSFFNPNGLFSFNTAGKKTYGRIELDIQFSLVGEDNWHGYNDLDYVSDYKSVGAQSDGFSLLSNLAPLTEADNTYYSTQRVYQKNGVGQTVATNRSYQRIKAGVNKILIYNPPAEETLIVGSDVFLSDKKFIGKISSFMIYGGNPNYTEITLDRTVNEKSTVFWWVGNSVNNGPFTFAGVPQQRYGFVRTVGPSIGRMSIKRSSTQPVYSSCRFTPKVAGQYKIRVRRKSTTYGSTVQRTSLLSWNGVNTRFDRSPIATDKSHLFLELKIRATNQLNGNISNLSAVCQSVLDVYDPNTETWSKEVTSNPAWVFVDLLTGSVNKKAISKTRLELDSISEWAEFCDEIPTPPGGWTYGFPRFQTNFILDYEVTLASVLNQVTNAAQASLNIIDGKYGVLIDKLRTTPVQIFTPRNSKDFSSQRVYTTRPHGLKVKYVNPDIDWEVSEAIAYDDGYNEANATDLEEMTSFACTNYEQAWRLGRYMIAQNKLRQETINITTDFEHIVCTRGDYVQVTQDVMRVGGTPARVRTVSGNTITIDDHLEIDNMISYGYVYRTSGGTINTSTLTVTNPYTFILAGSVPAVGDLIVIGEVGSIVYDCLVKSISPNDDMSATITLIEKADAIYSYESSDTIPDYDPQISATSRLDFDPPGPVPNLVVADSGYECSASGSGYDYFVDLAWGLPTGDVFEYFAIMVNSGQGYVEVDQTRTTLYRYIVDQNYLEVIHKFKVVAVSSRGNRIDLIEAMEVTSTPMPKTASPSDVAMLSTNITNEVIQLSWSQIPDCDVKEYRIKFSPDIDATWASAIPLLRVDRNATLASAQARTGTYLIKAFDFNGNESDVAAAAITTIPNLFNLNVIEVITESPAFNGGLDKVQKVDDSILLDYEIVGPPGTSQFWSEGYYYYNGVVDLGAIYTARLQSVIRAEGYSDGDFMSEWDLLSNVLFLSNTDKTQWDVESQYRASDVADVIADWTTLSSVTSMTTGTPANFTEWRPFTINDATGRVFQFRLKLISNTLNVTPRVFDGTIRVDMADRIESFENLSSSAGSGTVVTYSSEFKGPGSSPNVQVSIDGASSGDYWTFDYKTLAGLSIRFFNSSNVQVVRQFDLAIKGYGYKNNTII